MNEIKDILLVGEKVLWSGRPQLVSRIAIAYGLFALVLISVFSLPLVHAAMTGDMSVFEQLNVTINEEKVTAETPISVVYSTLVLLAFMFVIFGGATALWMVSSLRRSFWLTDLRAIIKTDFPLAKTTSINLANTFVVQRTGRRAIGTVTLFPTQPGLLSRLMALYQVPANSLTNIEKPHDIEILILNTIAQLRKEQMQ
ncbi:MAG: hypothetical protein GXP06_12080 [Alphaproteobacteria bacterium]|nr:hypothetical protein [Alphaproteobacteria bacterium]